MKPFWPIVCATIFLGFFGLMLLPGPTSYTWEPSILQRLVQHALVAIIVAGVWAICFRTQIENRRFSLVSLFVLTLMEGAIFALMKIFRH